MRSTWKKLTMVFAGVALLAPLAASASGSAGVCAEQTSVIHDTTPECNCTGRSGNQQICHSQSLSLSLGNTNIGTFSTGKSSSSCFSQELAHGECLFFRYVFRCCYSFWSGWQCRLKHVNAMTTTTSCSV